MISQENRQARISSPLGKEVLVLETMSFKDALSMPFEMHFKVVSDAGDHDFDQVVGHNVTVALEQDRGERYFNGYVTEFFFKGSEGRRYVYEGVAKPWFFLLSFNCNFRIFGVPNPLSVKEIVELIFGEWNLSDYHFNLVNSYEKYDYIVQYGESDFSFISRLLEKEGIYYYFEHENGKHTMHFVDDMSAHTPEKNFEDITFYSGTDHIRKGRQCIDRWEPVTRLMPTKIVLNDFNFETPNKLLAQTQTKGGGYGAAGLEQYKYPGEFAEPKVGLHYAKMEIEALQAQARTAAGSGNARGLAVGKTFNLTEHPIERNNASYLVTEMALFIESNLTESSEGGVTETFRCNFSVLAADKVFRPMRVTPKPKVTGPQTAIVVTTGSEVEADEYGRVRVQFPWERQGTPSYWIRVSQAWAGAEWGALSTPRRGHEVIVEHINGDPDRPIITGRVYNALAMPPYNPKEKPAITTIKTNSSEGGGGTNEIRIDDTKGEENLLVFGEKDHDVYIKNDSKSFVGNDSHLVVDGFEYRSVKKDYHETVSQDAYVTVGDTMHLDAGSDLLQTAGQAIIGNAGQEVHFKAGMKAVIEAGTQLTIKVGGSHVTLDPSGVYISGPMVFINSGGSAAAGSGTKAAKAQEPEKALSTEVGKLSGVAPKRSWQQQKVELDEVKLQANPRSAALIAASKSGAPFCEVCAAAQGGA